jgi:tRNA pseudouridine55 synthase
MTVGGFLLIDKPGKVTSATVARKIGYLMGGIRAGHLGTLDPMATGLLVVCVGRAAKLVPYLQKGTKRYIAKITFGYSTDTYDAEGQQTNSAPVPDDLEKRVTKALGKYTGEFKQLPPPYSAVKVQGQRSYKAARRGEKLLLKERTITIYSLARVHAVGADIVLDVQCSAGTYIRSLAHDLGKTVKCPATLTSLRRVESWPFTLERAVSYADLLSGRENILDHVCELESFLPPLPRINLAPEQVKPVRHGVALPLQDLESEQEGPVLILDPQGLLLAIGEVSKDEERVRIKRVIRPEP